MVTNARPKLLLPVQQERVIPYDRKPPKPAVPVTSWPARPAINVRRAGLLGLGINGQDMSIDWALHDLEGKGLIGAYGVALKMGIQVKDMEVTVAGVRHAEALAYSLPEDSTAAKLAKDLAGDMANRARSDCNQVAEEFNAVVLNAIRGE